MRLKDDTFGVTISTIHSTFQEQIAKIVTPKSVKVMLADSVVVDQTTFDPDAVRKYMREICSSLQEHGWSVRDVSETSDEDIRRIFAKFEVLVKNTYVLSGHLSVQFHALLYYKTDARVTSCHKELASISETIENMDKKESEYGDDIIHKKIQELGHTDLNHEELFSLLYHNDKLIGETSEQIKEGMGKDFTQLSKEKERLIAELDSLLIEVYKTSSVLIDEARLVTGEGGCLCSIDLERMNQNDDKGNSTASTTREVLFDVNTISDNEKDSITLHLLNVVKAVQGNV